MEGWISLHRRIIDHWIWINEKYLRAWLWFLLRANHANGKILFGNELIEIERGQFITSIKNISFATGLTNQNVRTLLRLLENDKMINKQSNSKLTKITILNYDSYNNNQQTNNKQSNKQTTSGQQAANKQTTTDNNVINNEKKDNNNIYNKFYDEQIKISNEDREYLSFVKILFGNNTYKRPLNGILKMEEQINFEQFKSLLKIKEQSNLSIKEILEDMEGWRDLKKNKTVLGTFRTFSKKHNGTK